MDAAPGRTRIVVALPHGPSHRTRPNGPWARTHTGPTVARPHARGRSRSANPPASAALDPLHASAPWSGSSTLRSALVGTSTSMRPIGTLDATVTEPATTSPSITRSASNTSAAVTTGVSASTTPATNSRAKGAASAASSAWPLSTAPNSPSTVRVP